jgi:hypothetical protein
MKRILLSFSFLALVSIAANAQARFGVQAGTAIANVKSKTGSVKVSYDSRIGFTVGGVAEIPFSKQLSFQPALSFTQKGAKLTEGDSKYNLNINYLELPLNVVYKLDAGAGKVFFGAGPSVAFAVSGKSKYEIAGVKSDEDIKFGNGDQDDMKSLDLGGNVLTGYELANGAYIGLNYNLGISNLSNDNNSKTTNNYIGVRIGFLFGGKKK